jgi:hypothetical protein
MEATSHPHPFPIRWGEGTWIAALDKSLNGKLERSARSFLLLSFGKGEGRVRGSLA